MRGTAQQPRLFVGMILILIFAEVLGKPSFCSKFDLWKKTNNSHFRSLRSHRRALDELERLSKCIVQLQVDQLVFVVSFSLQTQGRMNDQDLPTSSGRQTPKIRGRV